MGDFVKKLLIIVVLAMAMPVFGHEEMEFHTPDEVVSMIAASQGVTMDKLDCAKVADEDFETLGDAVMERMAGNHMLHEQMDNMMGGEDSTSLKQMHIAMGANWLGCAKGGMMGSYADSQLMMMRMMGNYYPAYYAGYDIVLLLAAAGWILFGVALLKLLSGRKIGKKR